MFARSRVEPHLRPAQIRVGIEQLSNRYVGRHQVGAPALLDSAVRRAAFALYYSAIHLQVAESLASSLVFGPVRRVVDLGCGTGVVGLAVAGAVGQPTPSWVGIEPLAFARAEALANAGFFGIQAEVRRGLLPEAMPEPLAGDLYVLGWSLNELAPEVRTEVIRRLVRAVAAGAGCWIVEPVTTALRPALDEAAVQLGVRHEEARVPLRRPPWLTQLDRLVRLDHREVAVRHLLLKVREPTPGAG